MRYHVAHIVIFIYYHFVNIVQGEYTISRPQPLVLGEPKSENQNNMLPAAAGEVITILDQASFF